MMMVLLLILCISIFIHFYNNTVIETPTVQKKMKVLTPEWGVAATLVNIGSPPHAVGSERIYSKYYPNTPLPVSVIDVGLRGQPNMELMAQLDSDVTIDTNFYDFTRQYYGAHTQVTTVDFGIISNQEKSLPNLSVYTQAVLDIGNAIHHPKATKNYLSNALSTIKADGDFIKSKLGNERQYFVTSFASNTQLQSYGINHPVALAAKLMGLDLITFGKTNIQGYATLPLDRLYDLPENTCLILVDPITTLDRYEIPRSPIWQRSPFYHSNACLYKIDPVWSRGGFNTLNVFSENLRKAVTTQTISEFSYEYLTTKGFDKKKVNK